MGAWQMRSTGSGSVQGGPRSSRTGTARDVHDVLGGHLGAHLLTSTGAILLVLALNRAARALVVDQRIPRAARGMMVR